jgi:CRP-like cAMP-binding protein
MHRSIPSSTGDIFGGLDQATRAEIEHSLAYQTYSSGQILFAPHDHGEQIFILRVGRVRIYKLSAEGRILTLMLLEPLTIFGEMALVGPGRYDTFAETMSECEIGTIARTRLQQIIERHPQVTITLMDLMGRRLRAMERKLADIAFKSVPQRLASVLLNLTVLPSPQAETQPVVVRYTHQQLAEMVGSYRETVTKALGDMREAGMIRVEDDTIILTDLTQLQELTR